MEILITGGRLWATQTVYGGFFKNHSISNYCGRKARQENQITDFAETQFRGMRSIQIRIIFRQRLLGTHAVDFIAFARRYQTDWHI
ncbi:hypothetical protein CS542_09735 [Pedobacter sp. IW39]|nr:hypothetical protein CS542_09735 [Pedobacter sp. IW39]